MRHIYATIKNKRLLVFGYEYDGYVKNSAKIKNKYKMVEVYGIEETNMLAIYNDIKHPKPNKFFIDIISAKTGAECIEILDEMIKEGDRLFILPEVLRDLELFKKSGGSREFIPTDKKLENLLSCEKKPILNDWIKGILDVVSNIPTDGLKETTDNIFKADGVKHILIDQPAYMIYNPNGYDFKIEQLNKHSLVYMNITDINEIGKIIADTSVKVISIDEKPPLIDDFVNESDFQNSLYIDYKKLSDYYIAILLSFYSLEELIRKEGNGLTRKYILPTNDVYISFLYPPSLLNKADERLANAVNECINFDMMDITDMFIEDGKKGKELKKEIDNKYILKLKIGRKTLSLYTGADLPSRNHLKRLAPIIKSITLYYQARDKYIIHRTLVETDEGSIFIDMPFNNKTFLVD